MSTVAEIESAIEQLPIEQVRELAAWIEEYQATIDASAFVRKPATLPEEKNPRHFL
jgi:hypothetical protein